jgi:ribosomal-protein-alanine N-acetyltransferase
MLKGRLCTVRHLLNADLNTFIALVNDLPSRGAYFSTQFKSPEAMRKDFMQTGFVSEDSEMFVIEDNAHHIVGVISHFKGRTPLCREIGYRLFERGLAGRGYVTEATQLLINYLFNAYQYHRLELLMDADNAASERIAQKCGFTAEGVLRQSFFINGKIRDVKLYSLLRPEWEGGPPTRA